MSRTDVHQSGFDACVERKYSSGVGIHYFEGVQTFIGKLYDWHGVEGVVRSWSENVVRLNRQSICPNLFFVGYQKTGKSAMLNVLLPSLFMEEKDASTVHIVRVNCDRFACGDVVGLCDAILEQISKTGWTFPLPEAQFRKDTPISYMNQFFDAFGEAIIKLNRRCLILIDEIQRLFISDDRKYVESIACALKHVFQPNPRMGEDRHRLNFIFAFTGSGMVTAFRAFLDMPANGSRFLGNCTLVSMTKPAPAWVSDAMSADLRNVLQQDPRVEHLLRLPDTSPVIRCYLGELMMEYPNRSLDEIVNVQRHKMLDEFRQDMIPYLQFPSISTEAACKRRLLIRQVANRLCPLSFGPDSVFAEMTELFQPFFVSNSTHWGFLPSVFCTFVDRMITDDGKLVDGPTLTSLKFTLWHDIVGKLTHACGEVFEVLKMIRQSGTQGMKCKTRLRAYEKSLSGIHRDCRDPNSNLYRLLRSQNANVNQGQVGLYFLDAERAQLYACCFLGYLRCSMTHSLEWVRSTFPIQTLLDWMLCEGVRKIWEHDA